MPPRPRVIGVDEGRVTPPRALHHKQAQYTHNGPARPVRNKVPKPDVVEAQPNQLAPDHLLQQHSGEKPATEHFPQLDGGDDAVAKAKESQLHDELEDPPACARDGHAPPHEVPPVPLLRHDGRPCAHAAVGCDVLCGQESAHLALNGEGCGQALRFGRLEGEGSVCVSDEGVLYV